MRAGGFFNLSRHKELVAKVIDRARAGEMGLSYDMKDASVVLDDTIVPGEKIAVLTDFKWRGATALKRDAAAYQWTDWPPFLFPNLLKRSYLTWTRNSSKELLATTLSTSLTPHHQYFQYE